MKKNTNLFFEPELIQKIKIKAAEQGLSFVNMIRTILWGNLGETDEKIKHRLKQNDGRITRWKK